MTGNLLGTNARAFRRWMAELDELAAWSQTPGLVVERISAWSIGQHIEHLLRADIGLLGEIIAGQSQKENLLPLRMVGRAVLFIGRIPRGKGKAPKVTLPVHTNVTASELAKEIEHERELFHSLTPAQIAAFSMNHPGFGRLNGTQWLRFLSIHRRHHLRIIREISGATDDA